jgi:hypothetical protein
VPKLKRLGGTAEFGQLFGQQSPANPREQRRPVRMEVQVKRRIGEPRRAMTRGLSLFDIVRRRVDPSVTMCRSGAQSVSTVVREIAESGATSAACSEGFGGLRLGVLDEADRVPRAVAVGLMDYPGCCISCQPW